MAVVRHTNRRRPAARPGIPHLEQLALHAIILSLALAVVLTKATG